MKRIFKYCIIVLSLLSSVSLAGQGSWELVSTPTNNWLNSVYFTDSVTGWVVGDSGIILNTTDGGLNWTIQQSNIDNSIVDVFFIDRNHGWASAHNFTAPPYGTSLLKTANGGLTWAVEDYPIENIFINAIYMIDTMNIWMGGSPHTLVSTNDGGITWNNASIDTSALAFFPVLNINFFDNQHGYASGGIFDIAGVIWNTKDGGNSWTAISTDYAPADEVHGLYIFDTLNVIGSGGDPDFGYGVGFISTINAGSTWSYNEIGVQGIAYDIDFVDGKEGWAPLGPESKFVYSMDSGVSWTPVQTPDNVNIFDITFPDSLHGYAAGQQGAVLKYIPEKPVNIAETALASSWFQLRQNFPNPFHYSTTIDVLVAKNVEDIPILHVYDIHGKLQFAKELQRVSNSKFQILVDRNDLKVGLYMYRVSFGNIMSQTKTMNLIN